MATIEIQHQLQMQYDDLKFQTLIKVSPFLYDNGCLLNNTKCTHLKGENEFKLQGLAFISKHEQFSLLNQWWRSIESSNTWNFEVSTFDKFVVNMTSLFGALNLNNLQN